ncbi:unnamed protein product [Schistosoma bovis]|nr:unnamed protein product [Schistosoma bovis]
MFKKNKISKTQNNKPVNLPISNLPVFGSESKIITHRKCVHDGAPLSVASFQPNAKPFIISSSFIPTSSTLSSSLYMENLSVRIWELYSSSRQSPLKYEKKVHLLNALYMVISGVFENAGLYIVGSSINGFGSNQSDMDMCLLVTSRDLHQKNEATFILSRLLQSLRKCLDWRVRPLGIFIKHWAQCLDIHDAQRGRLSTYCLLLMLIHYLQTACIPPILPNLQEKFPNLFNYTMEPYELDMNIELPWNELQSNNSSSLAELFTGFIYYYTNQFDFNKWAITIRHKTPLMKHIAMKHLPSYEQGYIVRNCKIFIEEPFSQANAARSVHSDNIVSYIKQAFIKTNEILSDQYPLESIMNIRNN